MSKRAELGHISPFFIVDELEKSVAYYREKLGFDLRLKIPDDDPSFAIVGRDQTQILLKVIGVECWDFID